MDTGRTIRERLGLPNTTGRRKLVAAVAIDSLGTGVFLPFSVLYFTRTTDLSLATVGLALSVAAMLSIPMAPVFGGLIDRWGPRRVIVLTNVVRCAMFLLYSQASQGWHIAVVVFVATAADNVFWATNSSLVAAVADEGERPRWYGMEQMLRNTGYGLGALMGTVAAVQGVMGYHVIAWFNAVSFAVAGLLVLSWRGTVTPRHPEVASAPSSRRGYKRVIGDVPFLGLVVTNLFMVISGMSLAVLMPVYLVETINAGPWWPGLLIGLNTALVVAAQSLVVRVTERRSRTRVLQLASAMWVVSFAAFAVSGTSVAALVPALLIAVLAFTAGELLWAGAAAALVAAVAPAELRGRYMSVYQLSWAVGAVVTPVFLFGLLELDRYLPWAALAFCSVTAMLLMRWLGRRLPADAVREPLPAPAAS